MINIGHNDWLHINLETGNQNNLLTEFKISFNLETNVPKLNFLDAAKYTAQLLKEKYGDDLYLFLSGGLDSEFVAKTFLENKLNVNLVVIKTYSNQTEFWYAEKFCHDYGVNPVIIDYSNIKDYKNLLKDIFSKANTLKVKPSKSLINNIAIKLFDNKCKFITGYGDPFKVPSSFSEHLNENFELEAHDFYLDLENQPSAFFTYTPELFRALIGDICQDKNLQIAKAQLYNILLRAKTDYKFYDRFAFEDMELPLRKLESYYAKVIGCGAYKLNKIQLSELFK